MFKKIILILFLLFLFLLLYIINSNIFFCEVDNKTRNTEVDNNDMLNIEEVYLTILPSKNNNPKYASSFNELNHNVYEKLYMEVLFQEGLDGSINNGNYGYSLDDANGILKLNFENKELNSYKVELDNSIGLWQRMEDFYLNKYNYDNLKIRNILSYDLFALVSDFSIPNSELVHLYIKDNSLNNKQFLDYGLYTAIEEVDKDFLRNNGLDSNGYLYNARNFGFYRYQNNLKSIDDNKYSKKEFEEVLEIKGKEDHSKLLAMLEDVNNSDISINQIIDKYFDEDNYLTWLAFNILIGNIEARSSDFYLYSSNNSNKWYFIGDYSSMESFITSNNSYFEVSPWQEGVSNYWGVQLHNRYLKVEENRNKLTKKIEELSTILSEDLIMNLLESYKLLVTDLLINTPDSLTSLNTPDLIDEEIMSLSHYINNSKDIYYKNLEKPMPVNMLNPKNFGGNVLFSWSESYDFQGDNIQYTIDISKSPEFDNIIFHIDGINDSEYAVEGLKTGHYYWRLSIKDSQGNIQAPFDSYIDNKGKNYFGVQDFIIN